MEEIDYDYELEFKTCQECGQEIEEDELYCSQECYDQYWADLEDERED